VGHAVVTDMPLEPRLRCRLEAPGVPADRLPALVDWRSGTRRALPVTVEVDLAGDPPGT
jgi:hypothetical protein